MTRTARLRRDSGDPALLRSALELAGRGWHVFPCATGTKRPALPGNWQEHATTDPGRIRDWWANRAYNIGISCSASGLVVVDLDVPKSRGGDAVTGVSSLAGLCQRLGEPYPSGTFAVMTPSGGTHLYFRSPGVAIANSAGRLGRRVAVRAGGGYVVGPGSRVGGGAYVPANAALPAPLPGWITRALTQRPPSQPAPAAVPCARDACGLPYGLAALREEAYRVATAAEGTRNDTLNRAAFSLGQLVAGGCLPGTAVTAALAEAARDSGLTDREATRTIRSGMTAGARRPRAPRARPAKQTPAPPRRQLPRDGPGVPHPRLG